MRVVGREQGCRRERRENISWFLYVHIINPKCMHYVIVCKCACVCVCVCVCIFITTTRAIINILCTLSTKMGRWRQRGRWTRRGNKIDSTSQHNGAQADEGCGPKHLFSFSYTKKATVFLFRWETREKTDVKCGKIKQKAGVEIARDVQEIITSNIYFY